MRLAGFRLVFGGHLQINILPGMGSCCQSFFISFVDLDFDEENFDLKRNKNPGLCLRLDLGVIWIRIFDEKPANRRYLRQTVLN